MLAEFLAIPSNLGVMNLAEKQLSNYNYTFPKASNVSGILLMRFWLTPPQTNPESFLPRRTRPYRNIRIVNVIREMFFTGGTLSFANRFRSEFPIHQGNNGSVLREVPIAMVAMVATAVSDT